MPIVLHENGAVYLRVSTDEQDAARQNQSTSYWLHHHGVAVAPHRVYEDIGWSRADAAKRPRFQQMLRDVRGGLIQWIVVDRADRFGAKDKFEAFHYLHLLREAGCKLFTVDDRELTSGDTASALITHLDYDQSERELREKSVRTLTGKLEFANRSEWLGGRIPYGMDVVALAMSADDELVERWRVTVVKRDLKVKLSAGGGRREYQGTRNFPASERDEILQLRPSQNDAVLAVIRAVYQTFLSEATTPGTIARQLAERGADIPPYADSWERHHVTEILTNPCYMGRPSWNRKSVGDYSEWTGGKRVEKQPGSRKRHHDRADWVMPEEPVFPPVISSEDWENAQSKMASIPKHPRTARPHLYTYSDLVFCGECGEKMHGQKMKTGRKQVRTVPTYLCGTYNGWRGSRKSQPSCRCDARRIKEEMIDKYLAAYFSDTLPHVSSISVALRSKKPKELLDAMRRAVDAHKQMRERIGANFAVLTPAMAGGEQATVLELPDWRCDGRRFVPEWETDALQELYRWQFEDEKLLIEGILDDLRAEQDQLIETVKRIPATASRAIAKVQGELDAVETKIADAEAKLVNAADLFKEANEEWARLQTSWARAAEALDNQAAARRKAEAIRAIIGKIVIHFKATGKRRPAFAVDAIQVFPKDVTGCAGPGTLLPARRSR